MVEVAVNKLFSLDKDKGIVIVKNWITRNFTIPIENIEVSGTYKTVEAVLNAVEKYFFERRPQFSIESLTAHQKSIAYTSGISEINIPNAAINYSIIFPHAAIQKIYDNCKKYMEQNNDYKNTYRKTVLSHFKIQSIAGIGDYLDNHNLYGARVIQYKETMLALRELIVGNRKTIPLYTNHASYDAVVAALNYVIGQQHKILNGEYGNTSPEIKYQCLLSYLLKGKTPVAEYCANQYVKFVEHWNTVGYPPNSSIVISKLDETGITNKPKTLKLSLLYPTLKDNLNKLKSFKCGIIDGKIINMENLKNTWHFFNEIKNKLMLIGYKEQEVVKLISTIPMRCGVTTCEITNQIIPENLTVRVVKIGGKVQIANAFYIHYINSNLSKAGCEPWYNFSANYNMYVERPLKNQEYYLAVYGGHLENPLKYLSVRALPNENVQVIHKDRIYRPEPYLGIELEVERNCKQEGNNEDGTIEYTTTCPEAITENVLDSLGRGYVIIKHDGTLKGYKPFEIVTIPATLQYHHHAWENFLNDTKLKTYLQSYKSGNCGMHVHISRDAFTGLKIAKFMRFFNCEENYAFICKVAQRGDVRCSKFDPSKSLIQLVHKIHPRPRTQEEGVDNHYMAINTCNPHTIEVRIFRGNLGKLQFYKNLEFVHAVFCYMDEVSLANLNYKDFLYWLFKNNKKIYCNLRKWLMAEGFNVSNLTIPARVSAAEKAKLIKKQEEIKRIQANLKRQYNVTDTTIGKGKGIVSIKEELMSA